MVDLAISKFHGENVARLTKIEQRIIGIDGNGTGRTGVLQRQDLKMEEMGLKLDTLLHRSDSWNKAKVWKAVKWMFGTVIAILALMMSWMGYRATLTVPQSTSHVQVK